MTINHYTGLIAAGLLAFAAVAVQAREDIQDFSIKDALSVEAAKEKLSGDVKFFFGKDSYAEPSKSYGVFSTSKKTNAFGKSDTEACHWAFLSAMIALDERALLEGGNAVVDIKSNYDNNLTESTTTFKCGAGNIMAGVALQGRVVTLP